MSQVPTVKLWTFNLLASGTMALAMLFHVAWTQTWHRYPYLATLVGCVALSAMYHVRARRTVQSIAA